MKKLILFLILGAGCIVTEKEPSDTEPESPVGRLEMPPMPGAFLTARPTFFEESDELVISVQNSAMSTDTPQQPPVINGRSFSVVVKVEGQTSVPVDIAKLFSITSTQLTEDGLYFMLRNKRLNNVKLQHSTDLKNWTDTLGSISQTTFGSFTKTSGWIRINYSTDDFFDYHVQWSENGSDWLNIKETPMESSVTSDEWLVVFDQTVPGVKSRFYRLKSLD